VEARCHEAPTLPAQYYAWTLSTSNYVFTVSNTYVQLATSCVRQALLIEPVLSAAAIDRSRSETLIRMRVNCWPAL
jgi:hypothetical protein